MDGGWYTSAQLLSQINQKLSGLDVTASYNGSNNLVFQHVFAGGGNSLFPYSLNGFGGNALTTLMSSLMPTGLSFGSAGYYSYIQGYKNIASGVVITSGVNDGLTVRVNNADHSITLDSGTYNQAQLVSQINAKLVVEGIGAEIEAVPYLSNLMLRSKTYGTATVLKSVAGDSLNTLFRNTVTNTVLSTIVPPNSEDTYIDGRNDLRGGVIIAAGKNDTLKFDLHNGTVSERKSITLASGEYDAGSLVAMINQRFAADDIPVGASVKMITTPSGMKEVLSLTYSPGENGYFSIDGVGGTASYTVFYPGPYDVDYSGGVGIEFQVGPNGGDRMPSGTQFLMNLEILGLETLDVRTRIGAETAIGAIDQALDLVSSERGNVGAKRNALEFLYNSSENYLQNMAAAESRIRDADMAKEMMDYIKLSLLSQASETIASHVNQQRHLVLQLLQD